MNRRVLSLWQPWATMCVVVDPTFTPPRPPKEYETRHWAPRLSLPIEVVIHATKRMEEQFVYEWPFKDAIRNCGIISFPRGALIGVATITSVAKTEALIDSWKKFEDGAAEIYAEQAAFGDYRPGRFAWRLEKARQIPRPIPFRGKQEPLYLLDDETQAALDAQLREVDA